MNAIAQFELQFPPMEDKFLSLEESHYVSFKCCAINSTVDSHKIVMFYTHYDYIKNSKILVFINF